MRTPKKAPHGKSLPISGTNSARVSMDHTVECVDDLDDIPLLIKSPRKRLRLYDSQQTPSPTHWKCEITSPMDMPVLDTQKENKMALPQTREHSVKKEDQLLEEGGDNVFEDHRMERHVYSNAPQECANVQSDLQDCSGSTYDPQKSPSGPNSLKLRRSPRKKHPSVDIIHEERMAVDRPPIKLVLKKDSSPRTSRSADGGAGNVESEETHSYIPSTVVHDKVPSELCHSSSSPSLSANPMVSLYGLRDITSLPPPHLLSPLSPSSSKMPCDVARRSCSPVADLVLQACDEAARINPMPARRAASSKIDVVCPEASFAGRADTWDVADDLEVSSGSGPKEAVGQRHEGKRARTSSPKRQRHRKGSFGQRNKSNCVNLRKGSQVVRTQEDCDVDVIKTESGLVADKSVDPGASHTQRPSQKLNRNQSKKCSKQQNVVKSEEINGVQDSKGNSNQGNRNCGDTHLTNELDMDSPLLNSLNCNSTLLTNSHSSSEDNSIAPEHYSKPSSSHHSGVSTLCSKRRGNKRPKTSIKKRKVNPTSGCRSKPVSPVAKEVVGRRLRASSTTASSAVSRGTLSPNQR